MKKIIVIDDYSSYCLWDDVLFDILPILKDKPRGMMGRTATLLAQLPQGDWCLEHGMKSLAVSGAYTRAGIVPPSDQELPALFCLDESGVLIESITRADASSTLAFFQRHTC